MDVRYHKEKPVANQADQSINNVCVNEMWLLFMDNARDRKDMESYLVETSNSRKPGGINKKTLKNPIMFCYISAIELLYSIHLAFLRLYHWFVLF